MIIIKLLCAAHLLNNFRPFSQLMLVSLIFTLLSSSQLYGQPTANVQEAQVKAAYIFNFTKLLQWPQSNSEYFYMFVLGKSPVTPHLNKIAGKEKVNGRAIVVNEISDLENFEAGSILYLAYTEKTRLNETLRKIKGKKIVLICSIEGAASKGAGIVLVRIGDKIRFEINRKALEDEGIIPNSSLLSLAFKVY